MDPLQLTNINANAAQYSNPEPKQDDPVSQVAASALKNLAAPQEIPVHLQKWVSPLKNGTYLIRCTNGDTYEGEVNDQFFPHGLGIRTYEKGGVEIGNFNCGKLEGNGSFTDSEGTKTEGWFVEGYIQRGFQILPDGLHYKGDFVNGIPEGWGVAFNSTEKGAFHYEGEFKNGKFHGVGTMQQKCEDQYETYTGMFYEGAMQGKGTQIQTIAGKEGYFRYDGDFVNNQYHGKGREENEYEGGKTIYSGDYRHGLYHGQGFLILSNVARYQGGFAYGNYEGQGKLTTRDNGVEEGLFKKGLPYNAIPNLNQEKRELNNRQRAESDPKVRKAIVRKRIHATILSKEYKEHQSEIDEIRQSITREIEAQLASKMTQEERDAIIKSLVEEEQGAQPQKRRKKRKQKERKPSVGSSSSSSQSSNATTDVVEKNAPGLIDPIKHSKSKGYKYHSRVRRWKEINPQAIRKFSDTSNGHIVNKYATMDDQEIALWRKRHHLPSIEDLLGPENENVYYWKTERGYSLLAELSLSKKVGDSEFGYVSIGVDKKNTIFHKLFLPLKKEDHQHFFSTPEVPNHVVDEEGGEWENNGFSYEIHQNGVIEFSFAGEEHTLKIYPINRCK